ncbi:MAG: ZIP family metal transporter [Elusimicrobia bacterium]|nr:ZIP family metal transporter [Elusimicrobiota bacterium]
MMLSIFMSLAVLMTFAGGLFPATQGLFSRKGMARLFSMRAGILLAVAFTEILPQAWMQNQVLAGWVALLAFALFFSIGHFAMLDTCPEYLEECRVHYLGLVGLLALLVHSFIDGFNLPVSFSAGRSAGIAVGLALALHKIADGFTLTSLFRQSGLSPRKSFLALSGVAAATPLGGLASFKGLGQLPGSTSAALLGFAAGSFIYIAATDLLPRLHKNQDRMGLAYFALGMIGMAALKFL